MKNKYKKRFLTLLKKDIKKIDTYFLEMYNNKSVTNINSIKKLRSLLLKETKIFYTKNKNMPFFRFTSQIRNTLENFFLTLCEIQKKEMDEIMGHYRILSYR